jgi:hypothetical protein
MSWLRCAAAAVLCFSDQRADSVSDAYRSDQGNILSRLPGGRAAGLKEELLFFKKEDLPYWPPRRSALTPV